MKAIFKNIGPISEAEMELGDLTIIAGQNNTGKTYLVYTLYGFLSDLNQHILNVTIRYGAPGKRGFNAKKFGVHTLMDRVHDIAQRVQQSGRVGISLDGLQDLQGQILQATTAWFSCNLHEIFRAPQSDFADAMFQIAPESSLMAAANENYFRRHNSISGFGLSIDNGELVFTLHELPTGSPSLADIEMSILSRVMPHSSILFPEPFILSAERFSISLFYKELDFTKNRLVEELQKLADGKRRSVPLVYLDRNSARYAKPISDNINFTRDLPGGQPETDEEDALDLVHWVEAMVNGRYKATDEEIRFLSKARVRKGKFNIPLHLASSSARGISDLYFYLQNKAKPGQLLIIDEPESHLSPRNQILMARLLAFCVRAGLKVLVTTHSDYLVKEFNNLIMLHGEFAGKEKFLHKHRKEYSADDSLSPESVRAYTCADGTLHPCKVDGMGVDMLVFDEAIDGINRVSNHLFYLKTAEDS